MMKEGNPLKSLGSLRFEISEFDLYVVSSFFVFNRLPGSVATETEIHTFAACLEMKGTTTGTMTLVM